MHSYITCLIYLYQDNLYFAMTFLSISLYCKFISHTCRVLFLLNKNNNYDIYKDLMQKNVMSKVYGQEKTCTVILDSILINHF